MFRFQDPCRNNNQLTFNYSFKDQGWNPIDLSIYSGVFLLTKFYGVVHSINPAQLNGPAINGQVTGKFTPSGIGVWTVQFFCTNNSQQKIYGDPVTFTVVANTDDLALSQLPSY